MAEETEKEKNEKFRKYIRNSGIIGIGLGGITSGLGIADDYYIKNHPNRIIKSGRYRDVKENNISRSAEKILEDAKNISKKAKRTGLVMTSVGGGLIGYSAYKHYKDKKSDDNTKK